MNYLFVFCLFFHGDCVEKKFLFLSLRSALVDSSRKQTDHRLWCYIFFLTGNLESSGILGLQLNFKPFLFFSRCQHVGGYEPDGDAVASPRRLGFRRQQRPPPPPAPSASPPPASAAAADAEESRGSQGIVFARRRVGVELRKRRNVAGSGGGGGGCSRSSRNSFCVGLFGRRRRSALVRPSEHRQSRPASTSATSFAAVPLSGRRIVSGRAVAAPAESATPPPPPSPAAGRHGRPGSRCVCAHGRAHGRPQFAAERPVGPGRTASALPSARLSESLGRHRRFRRSHTHFVRLTPSVVARFVAASAAAAARFAPQRHSGHDASIQRRKWPAAARQEPPPIRSLQSGQSAQPQSVARRIEFVVLRLRGRQSQRIASSAPPVAVSSLVGGQRRVQHRQQQHGRQQRSGLGQRSEKHGKNGQRIGDDEDDGDGGGRVDVRRFRPSKVKIKKKESIRHNVSLRHHVNKYC